MRKFFAKYIKKFKKINLDFILTRLFNRRIRNYLLPRLYYYLNLKPKEIMLDISSKCNAQCPFCPRTLQGVNGYNMDKEIFYKVVDEAYDLGIRQCRLYSTGEPLLHPLVDDFIRYLKGKNFSIMVSTNGQFLDKHFEALSLVDEIKISIEGWDKESYEHYRKNCQYERLQSNLEEFMKFLSSKLDRPVVTIGLMVLKETNIDRFFENWKDKCDQISVWPTGPVFYWDEDKRIKYSGFENDLRLNENKYRYVFDTEELKYCGYNFSSLVVSAKGQAIICCCDYNDSIVYGDLRTRSLKNILRDPRRKENQKQFIDGKFNVCKNCSVFFKLDESSQTDYAEKLNRCKRKDIAVYH